MNAAVLVTVLDGIVERLMMGKVDDEGRFQVKTNSRGMKKKIIIIIRDDPSSLSALLEKRRKVTIKLVSLSELSNGASVI